MRLRNAVSANSVNGAEKDSVSIPLDETVRTRESIQSSAAYNSPLKTNTTKYSKINEISASTSRSNSKDINIRRQEHERKCASGNNSTKPFAKVLPRQQSSITPTSLKEIPQQRRLSLDPHVAHLILKNDLDKERHGSLGRVDQSKHVKRSKSSKEKIAFAIQ